MAGLRTLLTRLVLDMSGGPERIPDARRIYPTLSQQQIQAFQQIKQVGGRGTQFALGEIRTVRVVQDTVELRFGMIATSTARPRPAGFPFDAKMVRQGPGWIILEIRRVAPGGER
jgi:hypothetical protein